jgi:hypothetical protein
MTAVAGSMVEKAMFLMAFKTRMEEAVNGNWWLGRRVHRRETKYKYFPSPHGRGSY